MKISYAITVCNEFQEIQRLINFLVENKRNKDEIVILFDSTNGTSTVEEVLRCKSVNDEFIWYKYNFDGHFANMKNYLTSLCSGDYIYQIDADEIVSEYAIQNLPLILNYNPVDVLLVPRINTVKGLTQEHINKWRWKVDNEGRVNFPDFQWRIYKNNSKIKWKNKVHEVLQGYETISELPLDEPWCLIHEKTIERQEKQNNYYNTII
jgi:GT2 family glycosyltransferase